MSGPGVIAMIKVATANWTMMLASGMKGMERTSATTTLNIRISADTPAD
jgi:hypothetical protein